MKGFRDFILRGNVVDLAVAVVIGAAFTGIVNSLVKDIINPLISATVGQPNFSHLVAHVNGGEVTYGNFMNAVISFLIVATVIYFGVVMPVTRLMARFHKPVPVAPPATKTCPECLSDIPAAAKRCSHCTQLVA
ncbi:MAG TPA: large conductance mechanosensitive channel protein MscL [Acidobacteriaceae bacterium]|nr:large conductance mechanosensitive channel protein MscL [Terriglobia bacterium]HVC89194.1 large conductance mechanosensitive channel protein MscL [Acidobacteriaceae bacterium]